MRSAFAAQADETAFLDAPFRIVQGCQTLLQWAGLKGVAFASGLERRSKRLDEWFTTTDLSWSRLGAPTALSAMAALGALS